MSISSIFASSATDPLSQLYAPTPPANEIAPTLNARDPIVSSNFSLSSAATSASVSDGAKLLKQLQNLQKNNPTEFKKVTADIAAQLQAAAKQTGGSEGTALTSLANKFLQASQTGSLSSLESTHHHHGGHHAAPPTVSATATDSTTSTTSSATSAAIAAYQQANSQSNPLTLNASDPNTSAATGLRSQVSGIISQVLTTELGSTATRTSAYA